jgi:peptidoglycan/LPS O-acetylase OafA/YrhL
MESAQSLGYRPEIDGLRAIAVLAVLAYHCSPDHFPNGYLGVDIFFVISGYVITASLVRRKHADLRGFLLDFYARRVRRLMPPLIVCVLVSAILISLFNPQPGQMLGLGWRALLGVSNLQLYREATDYFSPATDLNIYTHTWSLGVEEQFYLLFPILVWGCGLARGEATLRRRLLPVLLLGASASLVSFVVLQRINQPAAFFLMPPRFWEIAAGALLFLLISRSVGQAGGGVIQRLPSGLPLLLLLAILGLPIRLTGAWSTVIAVLATTILIGSLRSETWAFRCLSWRALVFIGLLSYSLYLWHWPVLVISRWTIGIHGWSLPFQVSLSLLLAWLSWRFVECPLRYASWWAKPSRALALGMGSMAAAIGFLLLPMRVLATNLFVGDRASANAAVLPGSAATTAAGTTLSARHCLYPQPLDAVLRHCRLLSEGKRRGRIVLLGDSHAARLFPLLGELNSREGWEVVGYGAEGQALPAVPYILRDGRNRAEWNRRQEGFERLLPKLLDQLGPGDVVLLKSWFDLYLVEDEFFAKGRRDKQLQDGNGAAIDASTARSQWIRRLEELADRAGKSGAKVVLMGPHPVFPGSLESVPAELCLPMWFRPNLPEACPATFKVDRAKAMARIEPLLQDLRRAAARSPHLLLFEPFNYLCPSSSTKCSAIENGQVIYTDNNHFSRSGSMSLLQPFIRFLKDHVLAAG